MKTDDGDKKNPCSCCKQCTDCTTEFEKIVDLANAGLVIYRRTTKTEDIKQDDATILGGTKTTEDVFILHNTKNSIITSKEYLPEMEKRDIACARCRKIMEHALKLLQKVPAINKNDITGICDHCKLKEQPCDDCHEAIKKFFLTKSEFNKEITKKSLKEWLSKIKNVLNDSFVGKKGTSLAPKRSQSQLHIDQLHIDQCRRESTAAREPHIRDLLYDLQSTTSARTLPMIDEISKKKLDVLLDHPQFDAVDRPLTFNHSARKLNKDHNLSFYSKDADDRDYFMDDILPATTKYAHDIERDKSKALNEKNLPAETTQKAYGGAKTDGQQKTGSFSVPQEIGEKNIRHKNSSEIITKVKITERDKKQTGKEDKEKNNLVTTISDPKSNINELKQTLGPEKSEFKQKDSKTKLIEPTFKATEANGSKSISKETKLGKKLPISSKSELKESKTESTELKSVPKQPKSVLDGPKELTSVQKEAKSKTKEPKSVTKEPISETKYPKSETRDTKSEARQTKSATAELKSLRRVTKSESKAIKSVREEPKPVSEDQKVTKYFLKAEHDAGQKRTQKKMQDKEDASRLNIEGYKEIKQGKQNATAEKDQKQKIKEQVEHAKENAVRTKQEKKGQEKHDKENALKSGKNAEQERKLKEKELDKNVKAKMDKKGENFKSDKIPNQTEEKKVNDLERRKDDIDMKSNKTYAQGEKKNALGAAGVEEPKLLSKEKRPQDAQIRKKNAQNSEEPNVAFNKIKLQQDEPDVPLSQIKGKTDQKQSTETGLPQPKINLFLKDDSMNRAKEENALNRKLAQAAKEAAALEKVSIQKKPVDDKKHLDITKIKMLTSSSDDLILKLVRLKQEGKQFKGRLSNIMTPNDIKTHHDHHRINQSGRCPMCVNSDLELDYESKEKKDFEVFEIVRGQKICKFRSQFTEKNIDEEKIPLLFQSKFDEPAIGVINAAELPPIDVNKYPQLSGKPTKNLVEPEAKGVIRYALSDRTFIEKGWTMLPTEKVVRKMNVYRMRPAQPEFDWFKRNKNKGLMQYESGERLAEFDEDGRGRWYYKNGRMALDYYDAEESNAQQRYVIYSNGEPDERGRSRPYTVLATFDYLGNGVVFDHGGKIRLKYNQTEGVVLDRNIGPATHWKWHTLNDPPVLQQVMIDTQVTHKDPEILKMGKNNDPRQSERPNDDQMVAIEFDNFVKEKSKKITQSFKPFQIKMKALKINEHFSLKVLDQATVNLIYRDGTTNLKLNIGMILDHKEIVDTDTAELGEVANSLEKFPAHTDSLAGLQKSVAYAERFERTRTERDRRVRPPYVAASADKLTAAASRSMRLPLRSVHSSTTTTGTTGCYFKCSRKPVSSNVYYDTRLV